MSVITKLQIYTENTMKPGIWPGPQCILKETLTFGRHLENSTLKQIRSVIIGVRKMFRIKVVGSAVGYKLKLGSNVQCSKSWLQTKSASLEHRVRCSIFYYSCFLNYPVRSLTIYMVSRNQGLVYSVNLNGTSCILYLIVMNLLIFFQFH